MKARRKEIYDVIDYTPGVEDGFTYYYGLTKLGDFSTDDVPPERYTHRIPYVLQICNNGITFKTSISSEVKILKYEKVKKVIPEYEFLEKYEFI